MIKKFFLLTHSFFLSLFKKSFFAKTTFRNRICPNNWLFCRFYCNLFLIFLLLSKDNIASRILMNMFTPIFTLELSSRFCCVINFNWGFILLLAINCNKFGLHVFNSHLRAPSRCHLLLSLFPGSLNSLLFLFKFV